MRKVKTELFLICIIKFDILNCLKRDFCADKVLYWRIVWIHGYQFGIFSYSEIPISDQKFLIVRFSLFYGRHFRDNTK